MISVTERDNNHAPIARLFLQRLGLMAGQPGSREENSPSAQPVPDKFIPLFGFLCRRSIGGLIQENLEACMHGQNQSSIGIHDLFKRLENWRTSGGEERRYAIFQSTNLFIEASRQALNIERTESNFSPEMLDSVWEVFKRWTEEDTERRCEYLLKRTRELISEYKPARISGREGAQPVIVAPATVDKHRATDSLMLPPTLKGSPASSVAKGYLPQPIASVIATTTGVAVDQSLASVTLPASELSAQRQDEPPLEEFDTSALWKYQPLPDEPDRHEEYCKYTLKNSSGYRVFGGRVRGRKHKHEGTNCDDWFEIDAINGWTIMAVSDGAGSCKFSRVGAKVACQGAIESLRKSLMNLLLPSLTQNDLQRTEGRIFKSEELETVQESLHRAMRDAREAMDKAVLERLEDLAYEKILGHPINVKDLSATLLIAVYTSIKLGERVLDLVMTCQVGDGMITAISQGINLQLLAQPDSGVYSGETEFLTSPRKLKDSSLRLNTHIFIGALRTLMLMTDGVSDDYFPDDPGMKLLYADLCLNGILPLPEIKEDKLDEALKARGKVKDVLDFEERPLLCTRLLGEDKAEQVLVRSIRPMAKMAGLEPEDVTNTPELLAAFGAGAPMLSGCATAPEEDRLLIWLDSYAIRGSFDDRTMVILFKES